MIKKGHKLPPRGEINGFSWGSRKRLQEALLTTDFPEGWTRYGLCLTVPGQCENWMDDWLATLKRWRTRLSRGNFLHSGVWRVELQQRGMPHIHAVMGTNATPWTMGAFEAVCAWQDALSGWVVDGKPLSDSFRWDITCKFELITRADSLRYLYQHTSKAKQAQLGYKGKQWGYLARKWLVRRAETVDLGEYQSVAFYRVIRRWSRRWYGGKFRGRLTRCKKDSASFLVPMTPDLKFRLLDWALTVPERSAPEAAEEESRITVSPAPARLRRLPRPAPARSTPERAEASKGAHSQARVSGAPRGRAERPARLPLTSEGAKRPSLVAKKIRKD